MADDGFAGGVRADEGRVLGNSRACIGHARSDSLASCFRLEISRFAEVPQSLFVFQLPAQQNDWEQQEDLLDEMTASQVAAMPPPVMAQLSQEQVQ